MLKLRLLVHLCLSQSWPKILKSFKMFPTWFSVLVSEIPILYNQLVLPHSFFQHPDSFVQQLAQIVEIAWTMLKRSRQVFTMVYHIANVLNTYKWYGILPHQLQTCTAMISLVCIPVPKSLYSLCTVELYTLHCTQQ